MPTDKSPGYMRDWREHAIVTGSGASNREKINHKGPLDLSISAGDSEPAKYWIAKEQLGDTADIALEVFKKVPVLGTTTWGSSWKPDEAKWLLIAKNGIVNALTLSQWLNHPTVIACAVCHPKSPREPSRSLTARMSARACAES